jgi:hypothetical protein
VLGLPEAVFPQADTQFFAKENDLGVCIRGLTIVVQSYKWGSKNQEQED